MTSSGGLQPGFHCSICLDSFIDPVTTPCGHNFCKVCIETHWDNGTEFQCPLCQERFKGKPQLRVNVMFRDLVGQFNRFKVEDSEEEKPPDKPCEVLCDVCSGEPRTAVMTCLSCEESVCAPHLESHQRDSEQKRHELSQPVLKLKHRVCRQHGKPLELVCLHDLTCVCVLCVELDHGGHKCVPLESRLRRAKLKVEQALTEVRQNIASRKEMVQRFACSVEVSKKNATADCEDMLEVFPLLHRTIAFSQVRLKATVCFFLKEAKNRSRSLTEELKEEIKELESRGAWLGQLCHTEDYLYLLKNVPSLCDPPAARDWSEISVCSDPGVGIVRSAVGQLLRNLHSEAQSKMERLCENELKRIQEYAVDVTLDPDTANPVLILSEDGKQVKHGHIRKNLPDNPERFSSLLCVLGKQGYSSGAFYFEVQVDGKASWDVGVALETVDRKGNPDVDLNSGYCVLMLRSDNKFIAPDRPSVGINLSEKPHTVGVFVDCEVGEVGFYDVGNKNHIYSYTGMSFPKKLHPYFNPCSTHNGKNSAPLVITPVK